MAGVGKAGTLAKTLACFMPTLTASAPKGNDCVETCESSMYVSQRQCSGVDVVEPMARPGMLKVLLLSGVDISDPAVARGVIGTACFP
eukprot:8998798-Karenia_brevis.AAC.1